MAYTVFTYEDCAVKTQHSFNNIQEAFKFLGDLDLQTKVERCILDDGKNILFDLKRNEDGNLET
jgi:hypothetical protein